MNARMNSDSLICSFVINFLYERRINLFLQNGTCLTRLGTSSSITEHIRSIKNLGNFASASTRLGFEPVSKKNGLQCQGACQKWAHYNCLNYTPGKIQDIKAGVIKITCPCPDCNTTEPKEILTDPPFTCTNTQCPANKMPVCASVDCPSNPIPVYPPGSLEKPPCPPCAPPRSPPRAPPRSPPCLPPPKCPSPKPKPPCLSPTSKRNAPSPSPPVCSPICPHQKVKNTKKAFSPKQSQSCSDVSNESSSSGRQVDRMRTVASDSKLPSSGVDPKILFSAIESLCNTVGQLSHQLKSLMFKIQGGI